MARLGASTLARGVGEGDAAGLIPCPPPFAIPPKGGVFFYFKGVNWGHFVALQGVRGGGLGGQFGGGFGGWLARGVLTSASQEGKFFWEIFVSGRVSLYDILIENC
jgi:hypothetical protein